MAFLASFRFTLCKSTPPSLPLVVITVDDKLHYMSSSCDYKLFVEESIGTQWIGCVWFECVRRQDKETGPNKKFIKLQQKHSPSLKFSFQKAEEEYAFE